LGSFVTPVLGVRPRAFAHSFASSTGLCVRLDRPAEMLLPSLAKLLLKFVPGLCEP
jgi:hypothetical protein